MARTTRQTRQPPADTPRFIREALTTQHPLVKGTERIADGVDWLAATAKDLYRRGKATLTPTPRRTKDIHLPRERARSARKR